MAVANILSYVRLTGDKHTSLLVRSNSNKKKYGFTLTPSASVIQLYFFMTDTEDETLVYSVRLAEDKHTSLLVRNNSNKKNKNQAVGTRRRSGILLHSPAS